jgi:Na+/proline symporter
LTTETIIFIGVAIYFVMMLVIGIVASKKSNTTANFIVAGRRMPIWICSATIVATWFGGGTMMGAAGASYERGLIGLSPILLVARWPCSSLAFSSCAYSDGCAC